MWIVYVRQPDALDYALVAAVTALAYHQWGGRHALHAWLLAGVTRVWEAFASAFGFAVAIPPEYLLLVGLMLGVVFLVALVEVVPRL